jgi:hypothetical protein
MSAGEDCEAFARQRKLISCVLIKKRNIPAIYLVINRGGKNKCSQKSIWA